MDGVQKYLLLQYDELELTEYTSSWFQITLFFSIYSFQKRNESNKTFNKLFSVIYLLKPRKYHIHYKALSL